MKELEVGKTAEGPFERQVNSRTAAPFVGVHYKTLERMARMGEVPSTKPGRSWLFLLSVLSDWRRERMTSNLTKHLPPNNNEQKENEE